MTHPVPTPILRRRWDPVIRLTHWGVALAVVLNGLIIEDGEQLHIYIGWAALALLGLRLLWGLIGTKEARFSSFPISISAIREHLSNLLTGVQREYVSHNPLGTLMVYALWGSLVVVIATGIGMTGSPFDRVAQGESMQYVSEDAVGRTETLRADRQERDSDREEDEDRGDGILEEIHEIFANLLLLLAALHVGGVALESRLSGRNLAREMVTGQRGDRPP
jgi:cytochrome b